MIKVYSKINSEQLLHIIYNLDDVSSRIDLIPEDNFLQCSVIKKTKGHTFRAHQHITKPVDYKEYNAQESWLVFKGKILVYHYDVDGSLLGTHELIEGWINITLAGGHTMTILEDDTIICEQKNGPYRGVQNDKVFF